MDGRELVIQEKLIGSISGCSITIPAQKFEQDPDLNGKRTRMLN